ncbi:elongation factor 1-beta [Candidatus Micrarchaeota archaeon]|nr:elongation factor 1-beta [Candidatus Micrarchaeota archaeon]
MGEVAVTIKVYPEDPEKLEEIKKKIGEIVEIAKAGEEPIGFGLVAVIITFVMEDSGGIDEIEEKIAAIPEVSQVQVSGVDRI